jgi:lycopene cyclase domain-containing protein
MQATYLILILVWAGPVIVFQWLLSAGLLIQRWKVWLPGILIPTLYLTVADSSALRSGTWTINPQQSLNLFLPIIHVPIEEAVFFLVTNTLIIQGIILLLDRLRVQRRIRWVFNVLQHANLTSEEKAHYASIQHITMDKLDKIARNKTNLEE